MKRFLLIAAVLISALAFADKDIGSYVKVKTHTWTIANNLATNVALLTAASGVDYSIGGAIGATVCAESGQTVTSGTMRAYIYTPISETASGTDPVTFSWIAYPVLDFSPTASVRCSSTGDKQSFVGLGRIVWVEDNIVVSGGTTVTVTHVRRLGQPKTNP